MNGGMVAGITACTDYDGDGKRPISLRLHANLDVLQAASAAADRILLGIGTEPSAAFFYTQAAVEIAVVALTDWDAGTASAEYESTRDYSYEKESA